MDSPISTFFEGKCVLVTGFSGFLGKVLVAKLIKSTRVKKVYVLIRDKNGVNYKQRTIKLLSRLPFTVDKNANVSYSDRVIPVKGDLTHTGLGIRQSELDILKKEVSIVFHSAAEVRFNVDLSTNYVQNVEGTANLIRICRNFDNILSFVHISSLYSAGHQTVIEDDLKPLDFGYKEMKKCLSGDYLELNDKLKEMVAKFPNSYTLTKALAEDLVLQEMGDIPTAIIRPSIVFVAVQEPAPGWGDTLQGIQGITISATTGLLQTVNWNYWTRFEMVPVDQCANLTIASAWYMVEKSPNKLKVINFSTGPFHPDWTFGRFFSVAREFAVKYPSSKQLRPLIVPPKIKKASILFPVQKFIYHTLFALFLDLIFTLLGYKKILYKYACKLNEGLDHIVFFASHQYEIKTGNYLKLVESLSPEDKRVFPCDLRNLNFIRQIRCTYFGFRKYFLGDDEANIEASRNRSKLICFVYRATKWSFFLILSLSIFTLYRHVIS
ncbi:fatty acyl-CoA reductase wat [Tetranychus urticae]|uniref:Fatty acyl-CoA reductase n=1 Tax=Tetranychus urticae TaxID=32264 RepID=T1JR69_TETUR|nr:fatty acyl-CoA reductase wat [Tetranychus urticae]